MTIDRISSSRATGTELDRERLRAVLEAIPSAVVLVEGGTGIFLYVNSRAVELYGIDYAGYDLDVHLAKVRPLRPDGTPYPRDDLPVSRSLRLGKQVRNEEMVIERADGGCLPVLVSSAPVFDAQGSVTTAVVVFEDITERKRREANLAFLDELSEVYGRISSPGALMQSVGAKIGAHLNVTTVSFCDVDQRRDTVTADHVWRRDGTPSPRREYRLSEYSTPDRGPAGGAHETLVVRDTQTDPRLDASSYAALDIGALVSVPFHEHGEWKAIMAVTDAQARAWRSDEIELLEEIADRIFPRLEQARAEEQLREADRRKDEFLAMLGHELRNPLAAIRSATQLIELAQPRPPPRLARAYAVLNRQLTHMTRLLDDLLDVSRITRGKLQLEWEILDLRSVVEDVLGDRGPEVRRRGLELEARLPPRPAWVCGDSVRLAQVLDNLVGNAIKFTSAPGTVSIGLDTEGEAALLRVRDTGVGIRKESVPTIFAPFQQEKHGAARASSGLGLGLAVARGLVELHGGTIEAESEGPGTGAEFLIRLPVAAAPATVENISDRPNVPPLDILVVEDHADAAGTLRDLLSAVGHTVSTVATGSEALDVLKDAPVDVVLCDIELPGMSGYDVAREIRRRTEVRDVALVAITGYGQPEDRRRALGAGFDEHIRKPVALEDLQAVLAALRR